jgi:hypothetical protein
MPTTLRPTLLIAALIAVLAASPAFARSTTSKQAEVAPQADMAGPMPAPISTPVTTPMTTGSVTPPPESRKKRMQDCMAIWDRGTHMTKREWRRTCNTQIDEDPNP